MSFDYFSGVYSPAQDVCKGKKHSFTEDIYELAK